MKRSGRALAPPPPPPPLAAAAAGSSASSCLCRLAAVAISILMSLGLCGGVSLGAMAQQPWTQRSLAKANNANSGDDFGFSVSLDGSRLAVGARSEDSCDVLDPGDNLCTNAGAVYIFDRNLSTGLWLQSAYLKADNADAGDQFGRRVSLSGDRVAVGAPNEESCDDGVASSGSADNACENAGAVYIFRRLATGDWVQEAYIKSSNTDGYDEFGRAVSLDNDWLAVGAMFEDSCGTGPEPEANNSCEDSGAVYVFRRNLDWSQYAYLKASNAEALDRFGVSVSLNSELLAVGAFQEDACGEAPATTNGCDNAGAVYVFTLSNTPTPVWNQTAYLKASNADPGDNFGFDVSLSIPRSGARRLAVSAYSEGSCATGVGAQSDNSCSQAGAAYIFDLAGTMQEWSQAAYIKASNAGTGDRFGFRLSLFGDRLAVAAPREDSCTSGNPSSNACFDSGATYLYYRQSASGEWLFDAILKASNAESDDLFGASVSANVDTVVVGASGEDSCANENELDNSCAAAGALYFFNAATTATSGSPLTAASTAVSTTAAEPTTTAPGSFGTSGAAGSALPTTFGTTAESTTGAELEEADASAGGGGEWLLPVIAVVAVAVCSGLLGGLVFLLAMRKRNGDDTSEEDHGSPTDSSVPSPSSPVYNTTSGLVSQQTEPTETPIYNSVGGVATTADEYGDPVYNTTESVREGAAASAGNYHAI